MLKWSWKIATVANIDVYLHMTFVFLIAWIALGYWQLEGTLTAVVSGVGFILALFFCVLLHEFGHALTARRYGIRTRNILLLPIGGIASIEKMPENPKEEIIIALAGPAVNFVIALVLWLLLGASLEWVPLGELSIRNSESFVQQLMIINLLLATFNLLPALPMDGGRVFRAAMAMRMEPAKATRIAARVAQGLALSLALLGMYHNLFLVFIAIFIWFGAVGEVSMTTLKATLAGVTTRRAMLTEYHSLNPDDSLDQAVALTLSGAQKNFPVFGGGKTLGVLRQSDLIRGLHEYGKLGRVDQVMQREVSCADIEDPLEDVLQRIPSEKSGLLVVTSNGRVAGIIDLDNISELIRFQKALHTHDQYLGSV